MARGSLVFWQVAACRKLGVAGGVVCVQCVWPCGHAGHARRPAPSAGCMAVQSSCLACILTGMDASQFWHDSPHWRNGSNLPLWPLSSFLCPLPPHPPPPARQPCGPKALSTCSTVPQQSCGFHAVRTTCLAVDVELLGSSSLSASPFPAQRGSHHGGAGAREARFPRAETWSRASCLSECAEMYSPSHVKSVEEGGETEHNGGRGLGGSQGRGSQGRHADRKGGPLPEPPAPPLFHSQPCFSHLQELSPTLPSLAAAVVYT